MRARKSLGPMPSCSDLSPSSSICATFQNAVIGRGLAWPSEGNAPGAISSAICGEEAAVAGRAQFSKGCKGGCTKEWLFLFLNPHTDIDPSFEAFRPSRLFSRLLRFHCARRADRTFGLKRATLTRSRSSLHERRSGLMHSRHASQRQGGRDTAEVADLRLCACARKEGRAL